MLPFLNDTASPINLSGTYFVTGTDTEVGKTTTTRQLIKRLAQQGQACYAIKPVTAGVNEAGESDDAIRINEFASIKPPFSAIAPIVLSTPCSPHIASHLENIGLTADAIVKTVRQTIAKYPADCVLVEGAGGWFTPINDNEPQSETLADVAVALEMPIILVVGIKLGCLNHAVLTLQAIWQAGASVAVVVFNSVAKHTAFEQAQMAWLQGYIQQSMHQKNTAQSLSPQFFYQPYLPENKVL